MKVTLRKIRPEDNERMCYIIRTVLEEFGGKKQGTAYYDYDTEHMFEAYSGNCEAYFVVEVDNLVVGGGGIKHLAGTDENIAELQKFYILPEYRGYGFGKALMKACLKFAHQCGYEAVYLETFENMQAAQGLYRKFGFEYLDRPLGGTGHSACPVWMLKKI